MTNKIDTISYVHDDETKKALDVFKKSLKHKENVSEYDPIKDIRLLKDCPANLYIEKLSDNKINVWWIIFDNIVIEYSSIHNTPRFADCHLWSKVYRLRFTTDMSGTWTGYFWTDRDGNTYKPEKWILEQTVFTVPEKYKDIYDLYNKYQRQLLNNARNFVNSPYDKWLDWLDWSALKERYESWKKSAHIKWGRLSDEEPLTCIDIVYRSLSETFGIEKMWKEFDEKSYDTPRRDSQRNHDWIIRHAKRLANGDKRNSYYMLRWVKSREKYILPNNKNFDMQDYSNMTDKRLYPWDIVTSIGSRHIAIVTQVDASWNATKIIHSYKSTTWVMESDKVMSINKVIRPTKLLLEKM